MKDSFTDGMRRTYSSKKISENDSVLLLERNLNHLKRQFIDLEFQLKTETKPSTFRANKNLADSRSCLTELNTKLFFEKENLEKKAISTMTKNAKLEEKVTDFKVQNSVLNRQLELELSMNRRILTENLEIKQTLEQKEKDNTLLSRKLDNLKDDVRVIEQLETRKALKCSELKEELSRVLERNRQLTEKMELLQKESYLGQLEVEQNAREKMALLENNSFLERSIKEKEKQAAVFEQQN